MSSPPPQPQSGPNAVPLFAGAALAVGGFFAAKAAALRLGYGDDVHPLRVAALCAPLFVGGVTALWPGRRFVTRVVVLLVAAGLGAAAWAFVPCRPDGPSLVDAVNRRDDLRARINTPGEKSVAEIATLWKGTSDLARDYPNLAEGVRTELAVAVAEGSGTVAARLRELAPEDVAVARALEAEAARWAEMVPDARGKTDPAVQDWTRRALAARSAELSAIAAGDWAEFDRTAANRRSLAEAFPGTRVPLSDGEDGWATRTARGVIEAAAKEPPKQRRELFRETEKQLLALSALNDAPGRFLAARQKLFAAAHEAARTEAREHIENQKFGLAFTVAVSHDLEWARTTPLLTADEQKSVAELRESCRYLAKLSEKAGELPEVAPEPRSK